MKFSKIRNETCRDPDRRMEIYAQLVKDRNGRKEPMIFECIATRDSR